MHRAALALSVLSGTALLGAGEVIPPKPAKYFNDYAAVVPGAKAAELNQTLEDFERSTSSQVVVAVFPRMQSDSSIEDYTRRVAEAWKVGQKEKNNGAVLFVFVEDKRMRIEVGYGLEGVLPDALAKRIIEDEIKPHFRNGDYAGGLTAGVTAMLQAAQGEYRGTGRTAGSRNGGRVGGLFALLVFLVLLIILLSFISRLRRGTVFRRSGRSTWIDWGGGSSGWSSGGGWSAGGGGGGFSGGGGSFGGGGASGSW